MGDLLIRDLSPEPHAELKRRAQDAGMSLQTYVARLLDRSTAVPPVGERVRQRLTADADAVLVTVTHLDAEVFSALARLFLLTTDERLARAVPDLVSGHAE